MYVLGLAYLDCLSAACLIRDGAVVAAAHEERFSRKLGDRGLPRMAMEFCRVQCGVASKDIEAVVFYEKPLLKMEQLLFSHFRRWPGSLSDFLDTKTNRFVERLKIRSNLERELSRETPLCFVRHSEAVAASAFFCSPYLRATVVGLDADDEGAWASIWLGEKNSLTPIKRIWLSGSQTLNSPEIIAQATKLTGEPQVCLGADDGMEAVGAAQFYYYQVAKGERNAATVKSRDWGPEYPQIEINEYLGRAGIPHLILENEDLLARVARLIDRRAAVGWFQGKMEFSSGSLGNRALLVSSERKRDLPQSEGAISQSDNPLLSRLVSAFVGGPTALRHGVLRPRNGPMACTPQNAFQSFVELGLDAIVLGNALIERKDIPYLP